MKKILTKEQTEIINKAFEIVSKDDIYLRELDLIHPTKKHIDYSWFVRLKNWENKIKHLNK